MLDLDPVSLLTHSRSCEPMLALGWIGRWSIVHISLNCLLELAELLRQPFSHAPMSFVMSCLGRFQVFFCILLPRIFFISFARYNIPSCSPVELSQPIPGRMAIDDIGFNVLGDHCASMVVAFCLFAWPLSIQIHNPLSTSLFHILLCFIFIQFWGLLPVVGYGFIVPVVLAVITQVLLKLPCQACWSSMRFMATANWHNQCK